MGGNLTEVQKDTLMKLIDMLSDSDLSTRGDSEVEDLVNFTLLKAKKSNIISSILGYAKVELFKGEKRIKACFKFIPTDKPTYFMLVM